VEKSWKIIVEKEWSPCLRVTCPSCQSIEGNSKHWTQPGKVTHWLIYCRT